MILKPINDYTSFLIIDVEATCDDVGSIPRHATEIIEIGAVLVEGKTLTVLDEYTVFVKPVIHPMLTAFCTKLTSITQQDVNEANQFKIVMSEFSEWLSRHRATTDALFCSWGNYDKTQFQKDCAFHGIDYPFGEEHLNIKYMFSATQNRKKQYGMKTALNIINEPMGGVHHRGIDDARNMVKLMPFILGRERI